MPIPWLDEFTIKEYLYKIALLIGIVIIIYGVLWILAELKLIPVILFAIFPQVVLLLIGIFIVYMALTRKNQY